LLYKLFRDSADRLCHQRLNWSALEYLDNAIEFLFEPIPMVECALIDFCSALTLAARYRPDKQENEDNNEDPWNRGEEKIVEELRLPAQIGRNSDWEMH